MHINPLIRGPLSSPHRLTTFLGSRATPAFDE